MFQPRSRRARLSKNSLRLPRVLRCEELESRTMLAAIGILGNLPYLDFASGGNRGASAKVPVATPPTVAQAASAIMNNSGSNAGTTAALAVLGSDAQGESTLVYTWTANSVPAGGSVKFSSNGTNAAKNDTVTFNEAGTYGFLVTIVDGSKLSVTSSVKVTVAQTLTGIGIYAGNTRTVVTPSTPLKVTGVSQMFTTAALDQFGNALAVQPSLIWAVTSKPSGAVPILAANGATETISFNASGSYGFMASTSGTSGPQAAANVVVAGQPKAFTVSQVGGSAAILGTSAQFTVSQFVDQFNNPISENTTVTWTATSLPAGAAAPQFSSSGSTTTVKFSAAGNYVFSVKQADASGNSFADSISVTVGQTPTGTSTASTLTVTGTSQKLPVPAFVDQFGKPITGLAGLVWSATTIPAGAPSLIISTANSTTTATFSMAGSYVLKAQPSNSTASYVIPVTVVQTFTGIAVTPGTASVQTAATQQFTAQALDQFQRAMASQPSITWTVTGGTVSSSGLYTAGSTAGSYSVTAKNGSISAAAKVTVTTATPSPSPAPSPSPSPSPTPSPAPGGLKDPVLAALVAQLDADGSLSRADMIQILASVGANGSVSATDLADLKTILNNAAQYKMPGYVQVLASDVVNGNLANSSFQGAPLGNLAAGSSVTTLDDLIGKWFLGTDLPSLTSSSLKYSTTSGSLFPDTPSHNDEYQGELGDCYFISSLGTIADSNPAAIENMFINNGDGTYTVRFYTSSGKADYVTVNSSLPTYSGMLIYADYGASATNPYNSLWIPLAEKAYAQWNQTGNEGRDGTNSYNSIQGGWMDAVDTQVLGHSASDYNVASSTQQAMINGLATGEAVTIGTDGSNNSNDTLPGGLYGSHAYAVIGYSSSSNLFTLYNPWGCDQPSLLSWSQLEATCDGFTVANTSGSVPISSGNLHAAVAAVLLGHSGGMSGVSALPPAATNADLASAFWTTVPATSANAAANPGASADADENHRATIFSDGSARNDSAVEVPASPVAAGVDAVLGSEDFSSSVEG